MVGSPSWRSKSDREALREEREWSEGISGGSGVVRNGQEALPGGWEWFGGSPGRLAVIGNARPFGKVSRQLPVFQKGLSGRPEVDGRLSQRARSGQEALLEGWEWSGGPPEVPEVFRRPFRRSASVGRPSRRAGSGQESLLECRMWSGDPHGGPGVVGRPFRGGRELSGGPPGGPGVVGRPSWKVENGREAIPEGREWSEGFTEESKVVGNGWEVLPEGQEWSGVVRRGRKLSGYFPSGPGVVGRLSWGARHSREALPKGREWSKGPPGGPGVVRRFSRRVGSGREWSVDPSEGLGVIGNSREAFSEDRK